jgi:hypothetical protein
MIVSTKLAAAVMGGLLLAVAYAPAWAGETSTAAPSAIAPAADHSLVGVLSPLLTDTVQHTAQKTCKPDSLYSSHSVVGDPDACFISRVDVRGTIATPGGIF